MDQLKQTLYTLIQHKGLTEQEVVNLTIRDVQLAGNEPGIRVLDDTTGQERIVELDDKTQQALVSWMLTRPDRPVTLLFPGDEDGGLSVDTIKSLMADYEPPSSPVPPAAETATPQPSKPMAKSGPPPGSRPVRPPKQSAPGAPPENLTDPPDFQRSSVMDTHISPSKKKPSKKTGAAPPNRRVSQKFVGTKDLGQPPASKPSGRKPTVAQKKIETGDSGTSGQKPPASPVPKPAKPQSQPTGGASKKGVKPPTLKPKPSRPPSPPETGQKTPEVKPAITETNSTKRRWPLVAVIAVSLFIIGALGIILGSILIPDPLGPLANIPPAVAEQTGLSSQYGQLSESIENLVGASDQDTADAVADAASPTGTSDTNNAADAEPTETSTLEPPTPTIVPTATPAVVANQASTSPIATPTEIAIDTPTPEPTATATQQPTATPLPTDTPEPTATDTPTPTPTETATLTPEPTEEAADETTPPGLIYDAPQLHSPVPDFVFIRGNTIKLDWDSVGELRPDEQYAVRLVYFHTNEVVYKGAQLRDTEWTIPLELYHEADGPEFEYFWYVYIERVLADGTAVQVSPDSETRFFTWD
ncbi:MAG: hypothetical protein AAF629_35245 [Chloroflexota bacterium]